MGTFIFHLTEILKLEFPLPGMLMMLNARVLTSRTFSFIFL
jgi:hypothetical protein